MTYPIQLNVPICPKCSEALLHNRSTHDYFCRNCKSFYIVVDHGATDRELICEEVKRTGKANIPIKYDNLEVKKYG